VVGKDDAGSESALVSFAVTSARAISGKSLFALVDVEMQIAGVCFAILGVQARNAPNGCSSVRLPEELCGPLGDAVLEFLMDEGLARRKFDAATTRRAGSA
jgi:hypothetical protein